MVFLDSMISKAPLWMFIPRVTTCLRLRMYWRWEALGAAGPLPKELDISAQPLHFHVSRLVENYVYHLHPQDITFVMFYFIADINSTKDALEPGHHNIGIEVYTAATGNDEATGWLCLD